MWCVPERTKGCHSSGTQHTQATFLRRRGDHPLHALRNPLLHHAASCWGQPGFQVSAEIFCQACNCLSVSATFMLSHPSLSLKSLELKSVSFPVIYLSIHLSHGKWTRHTVAEVEKSSCQVWFHSTGSRRLTTTPDILDFSSTPSTTPSARGKRTGPTGKFWMVTSTTLLWVSVSWCCFNLFNEFLSFTLFIIVLFLHLSDRPVTPNLLATLSENFYFSRNFVL